MNDVSFERNHIGAVLTDPDSEPWCNSYTLATLDQA
jgi:hypothetical protein